MGEGPDLSLPPPLAAELLAGVTALELARAAGVHLDTARRWKRTRELPAAIAIVIALRVHGELGEISRVWRGWRLVRDVLVSPEGLELAPGDLRAIPLRIAQVRGLERDLELAIGAAESDAELGARVSAYASLWRALAFASRELEQLARALPPALQDRLFQLRKPPLESARSCADTSDVPSVSSSLRAPHDRAR